MEKIKNPIARPTAKRERLSLKDFVSNEHSFSFNERISGFYGFLQLLKKKRELNYHRVVCSAPGREVEVIDAYSGKKRKLKMFASNNYLGLADHPYVKQKVIESIEKYGTGLGGPALLNGYTLLMRELEERLADLKHQEEAIIFSSGYSTNLGMLHALIREEDFVLYDELSHASFHDGIRLSHANSEAFRHNSLDHLEELLMKYKRKSKGQLYVGVEGVYSMDGDLAPLGEMLPMVHDYGAKLIIDDAHGTGILGEKGSGTAEYFDVSREVDLSMGTFSKAFAMTGGFLAASKEMISYIRYYARSYMFSASLPPPSLAAVLAGIDVIEKEPWRRNKLEELRKYTRNLLSEFNLYAEPEAAIIALGIPSWMNIRKATHRLYDHGIFLNAVEYPAVPPDQQRFRLSLMAEHEKEDIDFLIDVLKEVWTDKSLTLEEI